MSLVRRITISLIAAVGLLLAPVVPASGDEGGRPFTVDLTGAAEVPGPGDLVGSGTASLTINPGLGEVCWTIEVAGIAPLTITAAHIHVGAPNVAGDVVVPLNPYQEGCAEIDRDLALKIILNPGEYYVNVHTVRFPAGAVRGQLDRSVP
jgi:hypothetical protein